MSISYRTRRGFRRFFTGLGIAVGGALIAFLLWVVWAGRFIVYTPDGAKLDFSLSETFPQGEIAVEPTQGPTVPIYYHEPELDDDLPVVEATPIRGYYIDPNALKTDIDSVIEQVKALPSGTAVLLDMKDIKGRFYYDTSVGKTVSPDIDQTRMSALLQTLMTGNYHTIARIPAFRDWEYGLNNVPDGLLKKGGNGSLWMDDSNCYWLNPLAEGTRSYLFRITTELRSIGFDEVVFTDFCFPATDKIEFEGDKYQALSQAAQTLVTTCATDRFWVSFCASDPSFPLPEGNTRIYLENVAAADLKQIAQQVTTDDPSIHLLFLTDVNDTRFNDYCVLRPIDSAH